jgi:ribosome-interacting GTPase 1
VPANLPSDYYAAKSTFRAATTPQARLEALERMLAVMPHHKGTDHLRAELRARIAKVGQELSRQHHGSHTDPYAVHREGVGQVASVGLPNSGKSSLLHALTGASARTGEYAFTTQLPQPAMMPFEDIQVQLVDLPAVSPGVTPAWLRGLVPGADLLLLLVDLDADPTADLESVRSELAALRVTPRAPGRATGEEQTVETRPALVVGTKLDLPAADDGAELLRLELGERLPLLLTSAQSGAGVDTLRQRIVEALDVVRAYAKSPGRPPDLNRPFVLPRGATVEDLADAVHHELRQKLQYAVLWPTGAAPLLVAHDYELRDHDIIELHAGESKRG